MLTFSYCQSIIYLFTSVIVKVNPGIIYDNLLFNCVEPFVESQRRCRKAEVNEKLLTRYIGIAWSGFHINYFDVGCLGYVFQVDDYFRKC